VRRLKRPWTKEDDQRLIAMAAERRSRTLMAAALRRSEDSINSRLSILRALAEKFPDDIEEDDSPTAPHLHPMSQFNPGQPAILHDRKSDKIETWTGEEAASYRSESRLLDDGTVEWRNFHFDGWGNVMGG
jgi:hypothetical protein